MNTRAAFRPRRPIIDDDTPAPLAQPVWNRPITESFRAYHCWHVVEPDGSTAGMFVSLECAAHSVVNGDNKGRRVIHATNLNIPPMDREALMQIRSCAALMLSPHELARRDDQERRLLNTQPGAQDNETADDSWIL